MPNSEWLSRRDFLKYAGYTGAAGALAVLTGCGPEVPIVATPKSQEPRQPEPTRPTTAPVRKPEAAPVSDIQTEEISLSPEFEKALARTKVVPKAAFEAFMRGGASSYSKVASRVEAFTAIRSLEFSPSSTDQIIQAARRGEIFVPANHVATVGEFEFIRFLTSLPEQQQKNLMRMYAKGAVEGLKKLHDKDKLMALILEVGHMSVPPADKVEKVNKDRVRRGLAKIGPTMDTGASVILFKDGLPVRVKENVLAYELAQLIALGISEETNWITVFNSRKEGFPVDRFIANIGDKETQYISHANAIILMRIKEERLAGELLKAGIKTVRIAVHFNDSRDNNARGGYFMPQKAKFAVESLILSQTLAAAVEENVRPYLGSYSCGVVTSLDSVRYPFWMIDSYDFDDPEDVRRGDLTKIRGATNRIMASIRCNALGRDNCAPF